MLYSGPIDLFFIDDGELDHLTLREAFVLGVEWQQVRSLIEKPETFTKLIHMSNLERVKIMAENHNRHMTSISSLDNKWVNIIVR